MTHINAVSNNGSDSGWKEAGIAEILIQAMPSAKRFTLEAGGTLYREGERADNFYVVTRGLVKMIRYLSDGRVRIIRLHGPDSIIGLDGLMGDAWRQSAVAVNRVEGYRMPCVPLDRLRAQSAALHDALFRRMYDHLRVADTWITDFSTGSIKARVARLVGYLAKVENNGEDEVRLLTCEEMAGILGVTPESVSRVLAEFKRRDILTRIGRNNHLYEADGKGLQQMANDRF